MSDPQGQAVMGTLVLRRLPNLAGALVRFGVVIDGSEVGTVGNDDEIRVPLVPGSHEVHLQPKSGRGRTFQVQIAARQDTSWVCRTNLRAGLDPYLRPDEYILAAPLSVGLPPPVSPGRALGVRYVLFMAGAIVFIAVGVALHSVVLSGVLGGLWVLAVVLLVPVPLRGTSLPPQAVDLPPPPPPTRRTERPRILGLLVALVVFGLVQLGLVLAGRSGDHRPVLTWGIVLSQIVPWLLGLGTLLLLGRRWLRGIDREALKTRPPGADFYRRLLGPLVVAGVGLTVGGLAGLFLAHNTSSARVPLGLFSFCLGIGFLAAAVVVGVRTRSHS